MAKKIAMLQNKGGTGKTTSVVNVGAYLSQKGYKVLLIDLDPQASLTKCFGFDDMENNIYNAFSDDKLLTPLPITNIKKNLDIVASHLDLSEIEMMIMGRIAREQILQSLVSKVEADYDYIIFDCSPFLGLITINALVACESVLIPLQAEFLAMHGLSKLLEIIEKVKPLNNDIDIEGIFITRFDKRKILNRNVLETIQEHFPDKIFETKIRENIAVAEAPFKGVDIFEYDKNSNAAKDYKNLTEELIGK